MVKRENSTEAETERDKHHKTKSYQIGAREMKVLTLCVMLFNLN